MENPEANVSASRRDFQRQQNSENRQRNGLRYRFSPEELRTLKDCNRESFYFRCIPFAICGMVGVRYAIQRGFLRPNARWGATPKMGAAAFLGWILGKFSYRSKCEQKLMQLPNSHMGDLLRQKYGITVERFPPEGSSEELGDSSWEGSKLRPDSHLPGSLDADIGTHVAVEGLDDTNRPSLDRTVELPEEAEMPKKPVTSYDELRRRNRDEYAGMMRPFTSPFPRSQHPQDNKEIKTDSFGSGPGLKHKNQYGDSWED